MQHHKTIRFLLLLMLGVLAFIGFKNASTATAKNATAAAGSGPFVVCDAYPAGAVSKPTIATFFVDALPGVDNPITDLTNPCHYNLGAVSTGAHTITATFGLVDPVKGRLDSIKSTVLNFTLQAAPSAPAGLSISPN